MFHTYVLASSGNRVDFDRAAYLMDDALLLDALSALDKCARSPEEPFDKAMRRKMRMKKPLWTAERRAQFVWDTYCFLHEKKYGWFFEPDADPKWDH